LISTVSRGPSKSMMYSFFFSDRFCGCIKIPIQKMINMPKIPTIIM
jgi:hypothetical protein